MSKWTHIKASQGILDHLIQAVLIFASVFLAFWLNDYRLKKIEKRTTRTAIEAVVNEIEKNKATLERWAPRHEVFIARAGQFIEQSLDTVQVFSSDYINQGQAIFQEIITYDSWDMIRQANIKMDLDTRLTINRIYRQQEYVENALNSLTHEFFRERELFDPAKTRENYLIYYGLLSELYGQETAMIREYEFALKALKSKY